MTHKDGNRGRDDVTIKSKQAKKHIAAPSKRRALTEEVDKSFIFLSGPAPMAEVIE